MLHVRGGYAEIRKHGQKEKEFDLLQTHLQMTSRGTQTHNQPPPFALLSQSLNNFITKLGKPVQKIWSKREVGHCDRQLKRSEAATMNNVYSQSGQG